MKSNPNRFWAIVILLGWAVRFPFLEEAPRGQLCHLCRPLPRHRNSPASMDGLRLARRSGLLLVPIAFLAAMTFIRLEPMTMFLSVCMVLFLMGLFALTYLSGQWTVMPSLDYVFGYLRLVGSIIARPLGLISENRRPQPSPNGEAQSQSSGRSCAEL